MRNRATSLGGNLKGNANLDVFHSDWSTLLNTWLPYTGPYPQVFNDHVVDGGLAEINDNPDKSRQTKLVTHRQDSYKYNDIVEVVTYSFNPSTGVPTTNRTRRFGPYSFNALRGWFNLPGYDQISVEWPKTEQELMRAAMHNFYNFNETDNLTNILDAGKFTDTLRSVAAPFLIRDDFAPVSTRIKRNLRKGAISKRLLSFSNGYLAYSFGVAPLLHDMRTMAKALPDLKERVRKLSKQAGSLQHGRSRAVGDLKINLTGFGGGFGEPDGSTVYHTRNNSGVATQIATVRGFRSFNHHSDTFNKVDYLAQRFLSAGPASALWEKIPYSFVVDWFMDLSAVVDHLDNALTGGTKRITDASYSEKFNLDFDVINHGRPGEFNSCDGVPVANRVLASYTRKPGDTTITVGPSGRFGKKQGSLAAALLHQIVANLLSARGSKTPKAFQYGTIV